MTEMHSKTVSKAEQRVIRVLLVDDESGILKMFTRALTNYGLVTEEARSATDALERMSKSSFDVIVSDINMPGYGGIEFLQRVRVVNRDVPVILMTGKPSLESSNQAMERGAFRYLLKPVMPATLRETIQDAARVHETARLRRHSAPEITAKPMRPVEQWVARGREEGVRAAIVTALSTRAPVSAAARAKLASCNDLYTLTLWLTRAVTAVSEADVFSG